MKKTINGIILKLYIFSSFFKLNAKADEQSTFYIMPSPIAYPYFEADHFDGKTEISFIRMNSNSAEKISLSGAFGDLKGRYALSEFIAVDGEFGMGGLGGSMPGTLPLTPTISSNGKTPYDYRLDGDGQLSMLLMRMTTNLELQLYHDNFFSMIFFGGPSFAFSNTTITTPYSLIVPKGYSNTGTVYTGYSNKLTIVSTMTGGQFGFQFDFNLPDTNVRLSPFYMMNTFSGSATLTNNPGNSQASVTSFSSSIPSTTTTAFGFDIVFNNISIGSILQQMKNQNSGSNSIQTLMFNFAYHFSSDESPKTDSKETLNEKTNVEEIPKEEEKAKEEEK